MRNYEDKAYRDFRYAVKNRDERKCRWPGCSSTKKLQVHHILPWASHPLLRTSIANGITLCKKHHQGIKGSELLYAEMFLRILKNA